MAKLYPPTIAGTLPSFYETDYGMTTLVIPFSMNKTVSAESVRDFSLRIKTTNTDILYGILETDLANGSGYWNRNEKANPQVSFQVPTSLLNKLTIGQFYKVQLAYINNAGVIGYYSTVGIMKYTAKPRVEISGFDTAMTNLNITEYIGAYYSLNDPTEKVYEYRFDLFDTNNNLIETSGWMLHNSYEDTSLTESIDKYILRYALKEDVTYKIQYCVRTNNNLEVKSPKYLVMNSESIDPELTAKLVADLDYDNACINLNLIGEIAPDGTEYSATGAFLLSRSSSLDNYTTWLPISNFTMTGDLPSAFLFRDYTIEQGATYIYSLQQYNDYGIYSNRILTKEITAQFEDAYLFDGERQLRIRFNPKISSFKTVVLESKKNTIGSKYPYIFRNGAVEYKEFPINGLISYLMDNDEFFLSKKNDLFINHEQDTTDITDENVLLERLFKLEVLDWLNNGKVKLFKSPQEGNYIVRLMNVSLTPIDTVSRMLHNFSCQASEIADYTSDNLALYGLINAEEVINYQMRWETVILTDRQLELKNQGDSIYGKDLLRGYGAYHIKFTDVIQGTMFSFVDSEGVVHKIMIGATGAYEIMVDEPIHNLCILAPDQRFEGTGSNTLFDNTTLNRRDMLLRGSITFSIMSASQNRFDTITQLQTRDIPLHQVFGPSDNILAEYTNIIKAVSRIYYARFTKLEVREVYSLLFGTQNENGYLTGQIVNLQPFDIDPIYNSETGIYNIPAGTVYSIYNIQTIDENNQILHHYYRYYNGKLYAFPHYETLFPKENAEVIVLNEYTLYRGKVYNGDQSSYVYYRLWEGQLIQDNGKFDTNMPTTGTYEMKYTDLSPYIIYLKRYYDNDKNYHEEYYKFTGSKLLLLDNYSTKIEYGDVSLDVADKETIYITELDNIPNKISIGSGVSAELGLQVKYITYILEKYCPTEKANYDKALIAYHCAALGLEPIEASVVENQIANGTIDTYFIWKNTGFSSLEDYEILGEGGTIANKTQMYHVVSPDKVANQATIDLQKEKLDEAEEAFIAALQALLEAQEHGAL